MILSRYWSRSCMLCCRLEELIQWLTLMDCISVSIKGGDSYPPGSRGSEKHPVLAEIHLGSKTFFFSNFFVNVAFMSNVKNNIFSQHVFCWHWDCVKQVEMFLLHTLWQVYLRPDDQWWLQDSRIILAEIYSVLQPSGAECTTVNSVNWQGQVRHPSEGWAWPHGVGKETERSL